MKENFEHDTKDKHIHVVPTLFVCVPVIFIRDKQYILSFRWNFT